MNERWQRIAGALALCCALAAAVPADAVEPALIEALRANGAQIVPLGGRGGLDGYFVSPAKGTGYSLYVSGDGHAVAGLLYGPDGREVTGAQLAALRAGEKPAGAAGPDAQRAGGERTVVAHAAAKGLGAPSSPSRSALFERTAAAFGFTLGARGPLVVLMGDALCPWSRSAAARLVREALAGRLQLRVVPVAVLGAAAARRAAAIASHPDPARAWFEDAERPPGRRGGERIARNNALFDAWGADAVPLIAWLGPDGVVGRRIGDIDDVGAWLKDTLRVETLVPGAVRAGDGP